MPSFPRRAARLVIAALVAPVLSAPAATAHAWGPAPIAEQRQLVAAPNDVRMPTGVRANGAAVAVAVRDMFPDIDVMLGYRNDYTSDHSTGRAVDVMIPDYQANQALGWQVAEYLRENADRLNITYVIWAQRIWSVQRSAEGWRAMGDRGSDNANHYNHVHVSVE